MKRLLCGLLGWGAVLGAEIPGAVALRDARVVTVSGPTLERATVLVRGGLIEAVGEAVKLPADAWVIEARGMTVYPGLIDALSTAGATVEPAAASGTRRGISASPPGAAPPSTPAPRVRGPEDRPSNTSWLRAADQVDPADRRIEEARSAGFTSAAVFPTGAIFAGQGALINLAGERRAEMVVAAPVGLCLTLATRGFGSFPGSLMGVMAYIRQVLLDAGHYRLEREAYQRHPLGARRPLYDRPLEGVLESPRLLLPAHSRVELDRMARFAADLQAPAVLYGAHQAYAAAGRLAQAALPVLVSLKWPERPRDADPDAPVSLRTLELRERAPSSPAALAAAGVRFAFYSDGLTPRDARRALRRALEAGLSRADALRALTLSAAEIYGVGDRLGSIEPGKIANLVVSDGDLFDEKSRIRCVFIDGVKFEPNPEAPAVRQAPPSGGGAL